MRFGHVLVTGGAGFLGSQLVHRLLPISEHISVLDDLSTGHREAVPQSPSITFYEDSIKNEAILEEILPKVQWVFHLACRNLLLSIESVQKDFETNLAGGLLLLQKVKQCCPQIERFVYTSTASIYGNATIVPSPETYYAITLPYAASKFSMEHYCQVFHHLYDLPMSILRLSNVYGPGQLPSNPYCGVVSKFFSALQQREPLVIYSDGEQTRDFTYLDDAIDAIVLSSLSPQACGQTYNVGTGKQVSINELAALAISSFDYTAASYPIEYKAKRVVDHVEKRSLDTLAITEALGWKAKVPIEAGLEKTRTWFMQQQMT